MKSTCSWHIGLVLILLVFARDVVNAKTLDELYTLAVQHDAQVRAAEDDLQASRARLDQANAAFWPQLAFTGNTAFTDQRLSYDGASLPDRTDRFNTHAQNVQLTQPLVRLANHAQRGIAKAQVDQYAVQVAAVRMDLLTRLSQAFFDACQFDAAVNATQAQIDLAAAEHNALAARNSSGDAADFEVMLAGAHQAQAEAQQTEAQIERAQRINMLTQLTGVDLRMSDLSCFASSLPDPIGTMDEWLADALASSPQVKAKEMAVRVARAQLQLADGGHWPTLDLVANAGRSTQGPTASLDASTRNRTESVSLQLSVPLYSGGALSAKQREAMALLSKAEADVDAAVTQVHNDVTQAFGNLQVALAHERSLRLSVKALGLQAEAQRKRLTQGTSKDAEVLAIEHDLAQAKDDLARYRGQAMHSYIRLLSAKGQSSQDGISVTPASPP